MISSNYVDNVIANFASDEQFGDISDRALSCLRDGNESDAADIVQELHGVIHPTSKKRYRFSHATKQGELITAIFEIAYKKAPDQLREAAGISLYPLWKRVVWIYAPQHLSSILGNTFFKTAISVGVLFCTISSGYWAYKITIDFMNTTAIPFIVNSTHTKIIQLFKAAMSLLNEIYNQRWKICLSVISASVIILHGPNIPYLTAIASAIHPLGIIWTLILGPQTIFFFLWSASIDIGSFGWNRCNDMSMFFRGIAEKSKAESLACSKEPAYSLWVQSFSNGI